MVRALDGNPWFSLGRIRPVFALSAAMHIGLLIALAYFLAFHPAVQIDAEPQSTPIPMRYFPPVAPPKPHPTPLFHPDIAPKLADVPTDVGILPLPPHQNLDRAPPTTVTTQAQPAPELVIDPQPVYRGGLAYPDRALEAGVGGYVDFSFVIEPDGSVGSPQVIDEVPDGYGLAAAAKKAFPKWRFEPRFVNGVAVAAPARIRVTFKLK